VAEPGQGFYPYQAAIDAYGNGGFRFAGMSHRGSILALPTGMHKWDVASAAGVTLATLRPVLDVADRIDVLLIGLGPDIAGLGKDIKAAFREHRVIVEGIATGGAVRTYNILLAEERRVAAALIAVDSPR
jgi:uncharacterized protein